jgi:hypothetical protein
MKRTLLLLTSGLLCFGNLCHAQSGLTEIVAANSGAKWVHASDPTNRAVMVFRPATADPDNVSVSFSLLRDDSVSMHVLCPQNCPPSFLKAKILVDVCSSDEIHVIGPRLMDIHTLTLIEATEEAVIPLGDYSAVWIVIPAFKVRQATYPELSAVLHFK